MKARLLVAAQTPLSFRAGRDKERSGTLSYVPGTSLLGALASTHAMLRPDHRDEFAEFFLLDQISFGNLYPADFEHPDLRDDAQPVYPLPRTIRTCKRSPGFLFGADQETDPRHGISDHLIPWTLFALSGEDQPELLDASKQCSYQGCAELLDQDEGFYRRGLNAEQVGKAEDKKGIRTRTGISRLTGTVAEGILYSREVLHQGSHFWGTIMIENDELYVPLRDFVEEATHTGLLRVGNNRTRGFGRIAVTRFRRHEEDRTGDLAEQARSFDKMLREAAENAGVSAPHGFYLTLTLVSDAILYDPILRSQLQITGDYLTKTWNIPDAELIYQNAGHQRIVGWSDLWGLPKADERAISMGSVFVLGLSEEPDFDTLVRIQNEAIGSRRSEGFGRVRIADPLHQEVNPL